MTVSPPAPVPVPYVSLYALDLVGTGVFAVSGALAAGRSRMDVFGVLVVAAVTAVGGGTARDVLLGHQPVFWIHDLSYLTAIAAAAFVTLVGGTYVRLPEKALVVADGLGLAVFTIVGIQTALAVDTHPLIAVLMGAITGTVGGMVRDVLCGDVPLILRREIYATASLAGGAVYLLVEAPGATGLTAASLAGIAVVFIGRMAAVYWGLHLPSFAPKPTE